MSKYSSVERESQLEELYRRYADDVFGCAYLYLEDREIAKDVCQQVFIKAYRNIDRFRGEASPKTWLLRITANTCKSVFRSKAYRQRKQEISLDETPPPAMGRMEEMAEQRDEAALRWEQIRLLPPQYRDVLILRYCWDPSIPDVAGILKISTNAVSIRLSRAQSRLKKDWSERSEKVGE